MRKFLWLISPPLLWRKLTGESIEEADEKYHVPAHKKKNVLRIFLWLLTPPMLWCRFTGEDLETADEKYSRQLNN